MMLDNTTMEMIAMAQITPAQFAETVKSDGRTVRKFLRSITPKDEQPGKGSRWELAGDKRSVTKLAKQFADWTAKAEAEKAAREAKAAAEVDETEDDDTEPELEVEDA